MRRRWAWGFVAFSLSAVPYACGSSGSSAGSDDGGPSDGTIFFDAGDTGVADTGLLEFDTGLTDVQHVAPRYCAMFNPHPAFCDDFDYGVLGATWDNVTVSTGGIGELDPTLSKSTPNSFHAASAVTTAAAPLGSVFLRTTAGLGFTPSAVTYAFDYHPDNDPPTVGNFWIATLDLSTTHLFTLYLRDTSATPIASLVEEVNSTVTTTPLPSLPMTGQWTRIYITMDLLGGTCTLSYDTTKILDAIPIDKSTSTAPTIRIGVFSEGAAPAFSAHFDGAVLQLTP